MRTREERRAQYECSTISITTGTSDYNVKVTGGMFDVVTDAEYGFASVKSSQDITLKLNASTNDSIPITADVWYDFDERIISNMFITNASGSTASVVIILDELL